MKILNVTLLLLLTTTLKASDKPNILLIVVDDWGWRDVGYMGSDFYETPNIDRLASEGIYFTNAYSASANCAPARASLLSGQYTPRHKVYNVGTGPRGESEHRRLLHVPGTDVLDREITTFAELAKKQGYATASMGKWHLSDDPLPYGFDINIGGTHSGSPPRGYYPPHPNAPGLEDAPEGEYLTDRISAEAASFIKQNQDNPWLLYLTYFAVHTPLHPKKEHVSKYESKEPGSLHNHVNYATMVQAMDEGVGKVLDMLKALDLEEDTLVILFSDNGGYGPATDMHPLKGYKGTYYEGGIRVPLVIRWRGVSQPAGESDAIVTGVDIYPTIAEALGIKQVDQVLDGISLLPHLKGVEIDPNRAVFWHFPAYLQSYPNVVDEQRDRFFRSRPCSIVRKGDWKLHYYYEDAAIELYNLKEDIGETTNLLKAKPQKARELYDLLKDWLTETKADLPSELNPEYDPLAY